MPSEKYVWGPRSVFDVTNRLSTKFCGRNVCCNFSTAAYELLLGISSPAPFTFYILLMTVRAGPHCIYSVYLT